MVHALQLLLGLYPFAPLEVLSIVRPRLPAWAPRVTVRNLRIGRATLDLRFTRRSDGSAAWTVLRREGRVHVVAAPPPVEASGDSGSWLERAERAVLRHAPGRLTRAARIAIGLQSSDAGGNPGQRDDLATLDSSDTSMS